MLSVNLHHFDSTQLKAYMKNDLIGKLISINATSDERRLVCNTWLEDSPAKRLVFNYLYSDLLCEGKRLKVLDIGGGVSALTKLLGFKHDYTLIDILSHDNDKIAFKIFEENKITFFKDDWFDLKLENGQYDVVICNDLFPNVDQRLELFFKKIIPISKQIRMLLTYHNNDRFYKVKRNDAEELMFLSAWTEFQVEHLLKMTFPNIDPVQLDGLHNYGESLYPNGRYVSALTIENIF